MNKVFIIDGDKFSNFKGFCKEFSDIVLSGKYKWRGNLDAFNDILFGGFGDIETEEQFTIIWRNSAKSKVDLGYSETIVKLNEILKNCQHSNEEKVIQEIKDAKMNNGPTIFDLIEEIILDKENVTLILE
ncbi:barstar family protein [Peribacillus frigoritolerans]|uniref:barstar family protein n=2 Tax=Peribacillus TaxID=2675229 RepID=UPI00164E7F93|nr:barstar family protein [Peribacillus frigoritolerans]MED4697187.1 barstar family protein [Peribacillus frigoritolerans]QNK49962.1 barstar family protein [Brevibacterium sp. PAMC23299]